MKQQQLMIRSVADIPTGQDASVSLVLGFGEKALLEQDDFYAPLRSAYPEAIIALGSSAGEIYGTEVGDGALTLLLLSFRKTRLQHRGVDINDYPDSAAAGRAAVADLVADDLRHVFLLSDGSLVNGSELVKGVRSVLPDSISVTGGLAGDGAQFDYTLVGLNETPRRGRIAAIGLYGDSLRVAHGSSGGWEPFGLVRTVTKSKHNELFEIGHKSALEVYKRYLGKHAEGLPGSALLFPLSIQLENGRHLVRTILSIDEERQSMTFAGDIPEGSKVRFMMANQDRLTHAAGTAARRALDTLDGAPPEVAILVSCVGRKLVLGSRVEEEVEAVRDVFGPGTALAGYYSYGEIAPPAPGSHSALHNQTMTITCLSELS